MHQIHFRINFETNLNPLQPFSSPGSFSINPFLFVLNGNAVEISYIFDPLLMFNIWPSKTILSMLKIKSTGPASFGPEELIVTPAAILK